MSRRFLISDEKMLEELAEIVTDSSLYQADMPVGVMVDDGLTKKWILSSGATGYDELVRSALTDIKDGADFSERQISSEQSLYVLPLRIPRKRRKAPDAYVFGITAPRPTDSHFAPITLRILASRCTALLAASYSASGPNLLIARAFQAGWPELGLELICHEYGIDAAILWTYQYEKLLFESYTTVGVPNRRYHLGRGKGIVGQLSPTRRVVEYSPPRSLLKPFHPDLFEEEQWDGCQAFAVCSQGSMLGAVSLYWKVGRERRTLTQDQTSTLGDLMYGFLVQEAAERALRESEERHEAQLQRLLPAQALTMFLHDIQKALRDAVTSMNAAAVSLGARPGGGAALSSNLIQNAQFIDACMSRMSRLALLQDETHTTRRVDLQRLLTDSRPMYEINSGARVTVDAGGEQLVVRGDRLAIERAILNLVTNAVYGTEAKLTGERKVEVTLQREGDWALVSVSDTGVGILPDIKDHILDRFTSGRPEAGTGMGLAYVSATMKEHRGYVKYRNNSKRGATFELHFPLEVRNER